MSINQNFLVNLNLKLQNFFSKRFYFFYSLVLLDGKETVLPKSQSSLFDGKIIFLSLNNLLDKLSKIPKRAFFPLIHTPKFGYKFDPEFQKLLALSSTSPPTRAHGGNRTPLKDSKFVSVSFR